MTRPPPLPLPKRTSGWSLLPKSARRASKILALSLLTLTLAFPLRALLPLHLPQTIDTLHLTLLATAALLLTPLALWSTLLDARAKIRRRTGHCPKCNYDVRTQLTTPAPPPPCPECGHPL